jgi:hypothetical protein
MSFSPNGKLGLLLMPLLRCRQLARTCGHINPDGAYFGQCHGAMKAMGITIGKDGQLVITDKNTFATSNEPSHV